MGISLGLAFARFVLRHSHWSKDLIFLFPDTTPYGTNVWLKAYHGEKSASSSMQYDLLHYNAGEIQEAINLELCGIDDFSHISMYLPGLNGQQANADVPITINLLAQYAGIPIALHDSLPQRWKPRLTDFERYQDEVKELGKYIKAQSFGYPWHDHALYSRYQIEALTIVGQRAEGKSLNIGFMDIAL